MNTFQNYTLKVYVIHDESLTYREKNMNNTLKILRMACDNIGMKFKSVMITSPNVKTLQGTINELNNKIKYEKIDDSEFDNRMGILSIEQISNIEKHKEAWTHILHETDDNTIHLVLEDDAFIMNEFISNMVEFLQSLPSMCLSSNRAFDICFLGNTHRTDATISNQLRYISTREIAKILPSKESYIVTPHIIRRLINSLSTFRYIMRIHLSWFIHTNQDIRSMFPTKPILLDGSKIGICASTIHPMNPLVLNSEYMQLWQLRNQKDVTISQIRSIYKKIEHLKSADVLHLYGKLLSEKNLHMDAEDAFLEAIKITRSQHGILNPGSVLLNDAISNYKHLQKDFNELKKKSSKYIEPDLDDGKQ